MSWGVWRNLPGGPRPFARVERRVRPALAVLVAGLMLAGCGKTRRPPPEDPGPGLAGVVDVRTQLVRPGGIDTQHPALAAGGGHFWLAYETQATLRVGRHEPGTVGLTDDVSFALQGTALPVLAADASGYALAWREQLSDASFALRLVFGDEQGSDQPIEITSGDFTSVSLGKRGEHHLVSWFDLGDDDAPGTLWVRDPSSETESPIDHCDESGPAGILWSNGWRVVYACQGLAESGATEVVVKLALFAEGATPSGDPIVLASYLRSRGPPVAPRAAPLLREDELYVVYGHEPMLGVFSSDGEVRDSTPMRGLNPDQVPGLSFVDKYQLVATEDGFVLQTSYGVEGLEGGWGERFSTCSLDLAGEVTGSTEHYSDALASDGTRVLSAWTDRSLVVYDEPRFNVLTSLFGGDGELGAVDPMAPVIGDLRPNAVVCGDRCWVFGDETHPLAEVWRYRVDLDEGVVSETRGAVSGEFLAAAEQPGASPAVLFRGPATDDDGDAQAKLLFTEFDRRGEPQVASEVSGTVGQLLPEGDHFRYFYYDTQLGMMTLTLGGGEASEARKIYDTELRWARDCGSFYLFERYQDETHYYLRWNPERDRAPVRILSRGLLDDAQFTCGADLVARYQTRWDDPKYYKIVTYYDSRGRRLVERTVALSAEGVAAYVGDQFGFLYGEGAQTRFATVPLAREPERLRIDMPETFHALTPYDLPFLSLDSQTDRLDLLWREPDSGNVFLSSVRFELQ